MAQFYNEDSAWSPLLGTDQSTFVYAYKDGPFKTAEDLLDIVANPDLSRVSTQPPFRPKAGEIYVYPCDQRLYNDKRTWIYDGYRWRNNGKHKYPKPNPVFEKVYFNIESPNIEEVDFRRCAYIPINKNLKYLVVQYFGNEAAAGSIVYAPWEQKPTVYPPGPRVDHAQDHAQEYDISTVDGHLRLSPLLEDKRGIYKVPEFNMADLARLPASDTMSQPSHAMSQLSSSKSRKRKSVPAAMLSASSCTAAPSAGGRHSAADQNEGDVWLEENGIYLFQFSKKTFTDIMDIGYHMMLNNYFWSFISVPEIIVVFGSNELCDDLNDLLTSSPDRVNFLSYSTSPCLDGFFVSVLSMHQTKSSPVEHSNGRDIIPLVFMIHQNTTSLDHTMLLGIFKKRLANLKDDAKNANLAFVIDRDSRVRDAMEKSFPNSCILLSASCLKREAQCWLMKNLQANRSDRCMADLEGFLKSGSKTEFDSHFQTHKQTCSRSWLNFFEITLMDDLEKHCNSWSKVKNKATHFDILEEHRNPSLSQVLNDLELWHDATMDKLILSLYLLQQFLNRELAKGRYGLRTVRLLQQYNSGAGSPQSLELGQASQAPSLIVKLVMSTSGAAILNGADDIKPVLSPPDEGAACRPDQGAERHVDRIKQEPESDHEGNDSEDGDEVSNMAADNDNNALGANDSAPSGGGQYKRRRTTDHEDQKNDLQSAN